MQDIHRRAQLSSRSGTERE